MDIVDPEQVCTSPCLVKTIDILTMKKEDATFKAPFRVTATRNDYLHALVGIGIGSLKADG